MTDINSLKESYLKYMYEPIKKQMNQLIVNVGNYKCPDKLKNFKAYIAELESFKSQLKTMHFQMSTKKMQEELAKEEAKRIKDFQRKADEIDAKFETEISRKATDLEEEAKFNNKQITEEWKKANQIYIQLEEKRRELEKYADEVKDVCNNYGILSSDVDIDNSSFTLESIGDIYDKYISYMSKKTLRGNPVKTIRKFVKNDYAAVLVLLSIILISLTGIWDFIAIAFYVLLFVLQSSAQNKVKTYIILYGLIYNVQPLNMGFKDEIDQTLLMDETVDVENDERLNEIAEQWEQEINRLAAEDPEEEIELERAAFASALPDIEKEFKEKEAYIDNLRIELIKIVDRKLEEAQKRKEELLSEQKMLGEACYMHYDFNTEFILGLKDEVLLETIDIGLQNIIIRPCSDEVLFKKFIQVLLANALLGVRPGKLQIYVIDPNNRCDDVMSFYDESIQDTIFMNGQTLGEVLKEMNEFLDKNMKETKGVNIQDYNRNAEKTNGVPREYRLVFVISQPKELEEKEEMLKLMQMSAQYGVFIWVVSDELQATNAKVFRKPFEGVTTSYPIDLNTFGQKVVSTYANAKSKAKTPPLTWKSFFEHTFKPEEFWTYRADSVVEIRPGYLEGDPRKYKGFIFGHKGDVHMIGVGGTGAGKSVFLNFVILMLCNMYAPDTLELWMVDFKGSEFNKYIASELNNYKSLPHIKVCLCTSDGDYAGSVYEAFRKNAEERYRLFDTVGVKSLKDYNELMEARGMPEKRLPRILFINDEFQVIFQKADSKILDAVNRDLTYVAKVGRASGNHLFFTSQSMKGTLKEDTLNQFSLRFVLRCMMDTSLEVLGSKHSGLIKEPNGFLYVRSVGTDIENPPMYRTPFISDDLPTDKVTKQPTGEPSELQIAIDEIYDKAVARGFKQGRVITYRESDVHAITEMEEYFAKHKEDKKEDGSPLMEGVFILGERMTYNPDLTSPEHIVMSTQNNTHIFSLFNDYEDLVNFYKMMKVNIDNIQGKHTMIVNSQVEELYDICELDKDIPADLQVFAKRDFTVKQMYEMVNSMYERQKSEGIKDIPMYIVCIGWDKARGFGVDKDTQLANNIQILMQVCAEYHIHFIFISSSGGQIGANIRDACKFNICGKCVEKESYDVIGTKQAYKTDMKNGFLYLKNGSNVTRAKLYQYPQTRKVMAKQVNF